MTPEETEVEYVPPAFALSNFDCLISEKNILYHVLKMTDSVMIFINDKHDSNLNSIFVSLMSRYDNLPIGTRLLGSLTEEGMSKGISSRIATKLNKTTFVSCNLQEDRNLLPLVEKRLFEEIRDYPDKFQ